MQDDALTPLDARFTLRSGWWYAAELIGDEFGPDSEFRSHSPIRVDAVRPSGGGQRHFTLSFYHANYPEGVRDKTYSLQMLERGERFLLARSLNHTPVRILLIYDISWPWLRSHFGIQKDGGSDDLFHWLSNHL